MTKFSSFLLVSLPQSTIYEWRFVDFNKFPNIFLHNFLLSRVVFWLVFNILIGTGICYLIFADGKIQPWNSPQEQEVHLNGVNGHQLENNQTEDEKKTKNGIKTYQTYS